MKSKPKPDQYTNFEDALKAVLKVSHADMQDRIDEQKEKRRPKASASDHASDEKD